MVFSTPSSQKSRVKSILTCFYDLEGILDKKFVLGVNAAFISVLQSVCWSVYVLCGQIMVEVEYSSTSIFSVDLYPEQDF